MISVTDRALELLGSVVHRSDAGDGAAVRIVQEPDGWRLGIDHPRPEDETFEHDDRVVLIMEAAVAECLQDSTLDVYKSPDGLRLELR